MSGGGRTYYITPDGRVPNAGAPPGRHPHQAQSPPPYTQQPAPSSAPAPAPAPTNNFPSVPRPDYGYMPLDQPAWRPLQPAPPQRAPAAAPTPVVRPLPPGAKLNGKVPDFHEPLGYIFPEKHTIMHVVCNNVKPWTERGLRVDFSAHRVPTLMTVKELIRQLGISGNADNRLGITECVETGDGGWRELGTYLLSEERSTRTIGSLGWNESHGKDKPPVWIVPHRG
ncbi:hypothetical protein MMC20_002379 [Loxospora ochrophaea]|nr:hypothetical protein [Loxospora ochrophaea]